MDQDFSLHICGFNFIIKSIYLKACINLWKINPAFVKYVIHKANSPPNAIFLTLFLSFQLAVKIVFYNTIISF